MRFLIYTLVIFGFLACKQEGKQADPQKTETTVVDDRFRESYRPQYHFTPPEKWMNDPNGLLFHNGIYHLFYQYYPEDIVWGPMHWGHATSKDLIQWEHKPIALYPDELGLIFSGSAVMDVDNTSGLGTKENPPMVAIFTYHLMAGEQAGRKDFQTQGIAYSLDEGNTWTKYEGNPVIGNDGIKDFRDPKVMWHEASGKWIMSLVAGDHAKFYSSPNLKDWKMESEFGRENGAHGGVWECPDLFPLQVEGGDEQQWVLLISINPGAPNGGSGTQYFVGDFDGKKFTTTQTETKWLDYGTDNYAGVTWNGLPDDERTFIGWMSNWTYARDTPTEVWRSAMTLPRKLTLHQNNKGYYLKNFPVNQIKEYTKAPSLQANGKANVLKGEDFNQNRIDFKIEGKIEDFKVTFGNEAGEKLQLGYDAERSNFFVDRTASGKVDFQADFGKEIHYAPAIATSETENTFSIFIDASSVEFFVNSGAVVMTEQIFPTQPYTSISFEGEVTYKEIKCSKIERIWD